MIQICRARGWSVLIALAMICYSGMVTATTSSECIDSYISDGKCDLQNNNADCDYDGGDCCACTCDYYNTEYWCGFNGFFCLDESAGCPYYGYFYYFFWYNYYYYIGGFPIYAGGSYYADDEGYLLGTVDDDYYILDDDGDDYDDGDDEDDYADSDDEDDEDDDDDGDDEDDDDDGDDGDDDDDGDDGYYVVADDGGYDDADDETSLCTDSTKSDGKCDWENNNVVCDYDGGDCCECTCEDDIYTCGIRGYDCLDPSGCPSGENDPDLTVIIGATVGSLAALGIVIAAVVFCYCRKARKIGLPAHQATEEVVDREAISKAKPSAIAYPVKSSAPIPPPPPYEG